MRQVKSGIFKAEKSDTTPPNFEQGVINAIGKAEIDLNEVSFFAHGSTVVINALTEKKGAKTALITTKGFRDVIEIARANRPDLFNLNFQKPKPFVERYLRLELDERVDYKGNILQKVNCSELAEMIDYLKSEKVEAIAISFLHSYLQPENELTVAKEVKRLWPEVSVLTSHEISREWREYERTNTAILSAYVHPVAKKYIESLESNLSTQGLDNKPYMMQSNGGIANVEAAKDNPITMVESGPASGIYAAAYVGNIINEPNLIVLDIGGTTAKCTLIDEGEVKVTTEYFIERDDKNPGYPIQTPVSEIVEIGNGGGSIAWIDEGGKLHVGPQSAGAMPGPAAYGKGGTKPTTTDANLVLGRIDPNSFVGGEVEPDWDALNKAFEPLQSKLSLSKEEVARGIVRVANANMTNALRLVSTNKGYDPRDFALMAFGGGGAMHAVALAEELKVPKVIVPVNSSVFSALGMLLADLRRDYIQTKVALLNDDACSIVKKGFDELIARAEQDYANEVSKNSDIEFEYHLDLRYVGQEHTVKVEMSADKNGMIDIGSTIDRFHQEHEKQFTYRLDNGVEMVSFHLVAKVPINKPDLAIKETTGINIDDCILHVRDVDFDQKGIHETTIYDGEKLEPSMTLTGPAIIQEPSVTLVISPGHKASIDEYGNYHIELQFEV